MHLILCLVVSCQPRGSFSDRVAHVTERILNWELGLHHYQVVVNLLVCFLICKCLSYLPHLIYCKAPIKESVWRHFRKCCADTMEVGVGQCALLVAIQPPPTFPSLEDMVSFKALS